MSEQRKPSRILLLSISGTCAVVVALLGQVFFGHLGFKHSGMSTGMVVGLCLGHWINSIIWKKRSSVGGSTQHMIDFALKGEEARIFYRSIFSKRGVDKTLDLLLYVLYAALLIPVMFTTFVVVGEIAALNLPIAPEYWTRWFVDPLAQFVPVFDRYATQLRMGGLTDHIGVVRAAYGVCWLFGLVAILSGSARLIVGRQQLLANVQPGISGGIILVLGIVVLPAFSYGLFRGLGNIVERGTYSSFSLFWAPGSMVIVTFFALLYIAYFTSLFVRKRTTVRHC